MKKIILLILLITNSFANYIPTEKVGLCESLTVYLQKSKCESVTSKVCEKIPYGYNCAFHTLQISQIDDLTKPLYEAKSNIVLCDEIDQPETPGIDETEIDCIAKQQAQICPDTYQVIRTLEDVYCTKVIGYTQKNGPQIVAEDATKKAAYETQKANEKAYADALAAAEKAMQCGKHVQKVLLVRNAVKTLETSDIKTIVSTYADIKRLLDSGSLESAKEEINLITADGTLITNDDKTALVAAINGCK